MRRKRLTSLILIVFIVAVAPLLLSQEANHPIAQAPPPQKTVDSPKHRGVSWVAGRKITEQHIQPLIAHHVNWIVQTPFGWQRSVNSPAISLVGGGGVFWGETDEGLSITTTLARQAGIRTLLKPHIWLRDRSGGKWRGDIQMDSEEHWQQWFASYKNFILHYAQFAQDNDIEALCIGMELRATIKQRDRDWRDIIAEIRKIYDGKLTYAANWYAEFEEVKFWDELDYIGIQGYFPLSDHDKPTVDELKRGWTEHLNKIERIHKRFNKPVLFTELGYRATADAAIRPWEWIKPGDDREVDTQTQARCYQAFFEAVWGKPWCAGVYWWKWHPTTASQGKGNNPLFTPQFKPAAKVMAEWYEQTEE